MRDVTYSELCDFNDCLIPQIQSCIDETKKVILVAIPRGGLYLTQDVSYNILFDKLILAKSSKDIFEKLGEDLSEYQILICDDIYDSGRRYQAFEEVWSYPQNKMCVQIARYRAGLPENVLCGGTVEHDEYVLFPWEQNDTGADACPS